jgi:3-oxoadipyl-CoA thiolase
MSPAFLVDGIRTPIGKFQGALSPVRADDLAAHVIRSLMERHPQLPPDIIEDVFLGCANQAGEDNRNVARMATLLAGLPSSVPAETVNRLCASGMAAATHAARAIRLGEGDVFLAGGIEHMTRSPWVISKATQAFGRDATMYDSSFGWRFVNPDLQRQYGTESMGQTAENLAREHGISRVDQDLFACRSQSKAATASANGWPAMEITPVHIPRRNAPPIVIDQDEFPKPSTTLDGLARLRPAFLPEDQGGTVTAGNAAGLNDGAAALLLASEKVVEQYGLQPLATILSSATAGVEPRVMGIGPVPASAKALHRAGLSLDDIDVIELNEAFAAQVLACTRSWGIQDDDPRLNPAGGAIAYGHPLGMTGARLLLTAARTLHHLRKRYALVTMCVGVGQGYAVILERC